MTKPLSRLVAVLVCLLVLPSCRFGRAKADKTIVLWHWMSDRNEVLHQLAAKYKAQTGITVELLLYAPREVYVQKVREGAATKTLPDIFGILGEVYDVASFIQAGHVEDLTAALGEGEGSWKSAFFSAALETSRFKDGNVAKIAPGYYGIPLDVSTIPMIYNKKLFAKAGLDPEKPPKTWDDFLLAGKKLHASGVSGFVSGWAESWMIYSLATDLAANLMGRDKVFDTFRGKVPYTDSQWVQVFTAFDKMRRANLPCPNLVTLNNKRAEQIFAAEQAGMTLNGSWAVNVYAGMNPKLEYAAFYPPMLNPGHPPVVWGGAGSILYINSESTRKDKAIAFLKWLTEKEQISFFVQATKNLPSVKGLSDKDISPLLGQFAAVMDHAIHPYSFEVSEDPRVQDLFIKGIQSVLTGRKSPAQVAEEVQALKSQTKNE